MHGSVPITTADRVIANKCGHRKEASGEEKTIRYGTRAGKSNEKTQGIFFSVILLLLSKQQCCAQRGVQHNE